MYVEIAVMLICTSLLAVWSFILTRSIATRIVLEIKNLDSSLVEIVERIMGGDLMGNIEPMNPIQALLAQFIQTKIESMPKSVAVVKDLTPDKDELGRFVSKDTSS